MSELDARLGEGAYICIAPQWPYSGKRYMQMYPVPQHPQPQHSPHMMPPMPPPMPPPSYEEDTAAQAAARGYVFYPPYGYPGQVRVIFCWNFCLILSIFCVAYDAWNGARTARCLYAWSIYATYVPSRHASKWYASDFWSMSGWVLIVFPAMYAPPGMGQMPRKSSFLLRC